MTIRVGRARAAMRAARRGYPAATTARDGDAARFFSLSSSEKDSRRFCGLSCIYLTLRLLDGAKGESIGYQQCAAAPEGGSIVSIVGAVFWEE